jgi:hypothetical protein
MRQPSESLHSASNGLNQGNHTGTGFNDGHGNLNSIDLQLPGKQTETLVRLIHGRIWNSVFINVGQIGMSNGTLRPPIVSGGGGRSGKHGREGLQSAQWPKVTSPIEKITARNIINFIFESPEPNCLSI